MAYKGATRTFDTFTDLRLQKGTANVHVNLLGGIAISDGLGGDFYWSDSSTVPDDNENVIQATVPTGRWVRVGVTV